jgi:hypothetical protein
MNKRKNTNTWINVLHDIVDNLNNTPHTTLSNILRRSATPQSMTAADEIKIREHEMRLAVASRKEIDKLKVVINYTRVRLLVAKTKQGGKDHYAKSHRANWTVDTYKVIGRNGPNSFLIDVPHNEIKIWPAHSLQILSDAESEKENLKLEPIVVMGTGGMTTESKLYKEKPIPQKPTKPNTRVNIKVASAKRMEALDISEAEQKKALLQHKRRPTLTTRSKK